MPYLNKADQRNRDLQRRYGITLKKYQALWDTQGGLCAICGKKKKLGVDHNHKTRKVRGLLCTRCNVALAAFGDNMAGMMRVIHYLIDDL